MWHKRQMIKYQNMCQDVAMSAVLCHKYQVLGYRLVAVIFDGGALSTYDGQSVYIMPHRC